MYEECFHLYVFVLWKVVVFVAILLRREKHKKLIFEKGHNFTRISMRPLLITPKAPHFERTLPFQDTIHMRWGSYLTPVGAWTYTTVADLKYCVYFWREKIDATYAGSVFYSQNHFPLVHGNVWIMRTAAANSIHREKAC